jgi:hypothetical protein
MVVTVDGKEKVDVGIFQQRNRLNWANDLMLGENRSRSY